MKQSVINRSIIHEANKKKTLRFAIIWTSNVFVALVFLAGLFFNATDAKAVDVTLQPSLTPLSYGTPTFISTGSNHGNYPCTVAPQGTNQWGIVFPTHVIPTIYHPTGTMIPVSTGTATSTGTVTATTVPTNGNFHLDSIVSSGNESNYHTGSCSGSGGGHQYNCEGTIENTSSGNWTLIRFTFHAPIGTKLYYRHWAEYRIGLAGWGNVMTKWSTNQTTLNNHNPSSPTGISTYDYSGDYTTAFGFTAFYYDAKSEGLKAGSPSFYIIYHAQISDQPLVQNTQTPTVTPTVSSTPTITLVPSGTQYPCTQIGQFNPNNPIATFPQLVYTYTGCYTILPGFIIPLGGLLGLSDVVVPAVGICIMQVTISATFLGISIDYILSTFIILGLAFSLFNEFRS